jgi:hypothetical protein
MRRNLVWLCAAAALGCAARSNGQMVVGWWGSQQKCKYRTMTWEGREKGPTRLYVDLSAIPKGTRVFHASLRMSTDKPKLPVHSRAYMEPGYYDPLRIYGEYSVTKPILIYPLHKGPDGKPAPDEKALELDPPRYRSFDVTPVVQEWVNGTRPNLGFLVERFEIWVHWQSVLEIRYEGTPPEDRPTQPTDLQVTHRKGQTFITWTEIDKLITQDPVRWKDFEAAFVRAFPKMTHTWWKLKSKPRRAVWYRIYRHDEPITAANLHEADFVDEIYPLSGYDGRIHQHTCRGENWTGLDPDVIVPRYVITDPPEGKLEPTGMFKKLPEWRGRQLPLHTGLYVHQAREPGKAYYAVTVLVNGVENTADFSAANALAQPVDETVDPGEPILYRVLEQRIGHGRRAVPAETQYYVYWAAPPYHNLPRQPFHVMVSLPRADAGPKIALRSGVRDMYWSELVGGTHPYEWKKAGDGRLLNIIRDLPRRECGVNANCYTLRPRKPAKYQPYWDRIGDLLSPWAKTLEPRLIGKPDK